jgi:glyoxylase-like metal-dependent hydrolase (beta-lactamase superfamily II)
MPADWFYTREVSTGVWLVSEPSQVNSFLVAGDESAVAVDTGLGIAPIRPVHERLTRLRIDVVNTHYHADHVGGNHEYESIAIHEYGAEMIGNEVPRQLLDEYMSYAQRMIAAGRALKEIDREYFHLLNAESEPKPLPDGFDPRAWTIVPSRATRLLADGDRLDLGGRVLTVLHTPGHSPDSLCLLDERDGVFFAGDMLATGPIYAHFPDSDVAAFAASARRLAELADEVSLVLVGHFGRVAVEASILAELADGFARLLERDVELEPFYDLHLNPVRIARFDRFSVTVPWDWHVT